MRASQKYEKFAKTLTQKQLEAVEKAIAMLEAGQAGPKLAEKITRKKNLWCLRVQAKDAWIRIFYTTAETCEKVLLSGFFKKSNETPVREIEAAYALACAL